MTNRMSSDEILKKRFGKKMEVLFDINQRILEYFNHILRNKKYRLRKQVTMGEIRVDADQVKRRFDGCETGKITFNVL